MYMGITDTDFDELFPSIYKVFFKIRCDKYSVYFTNGLLLNKKFVKSIDDIFEHKYSKYSDFILLYSFDEDKEGAKLSFEYHLMPSENKEYSEHLKNAIFESKLNDEILNYLLAKYDGFKKYRLLTSGCESDELKYWYVFAMKK